MLSIGKRPKRPLQRPLREPASQGAHGNAQLPQRAQEIEEHQLDAANPSSALLQRTSCLPPPLPPGRRMRRCRRRRSMCCCHMRLSRIDMWHNRALL